MSKRVFLIFFLIFIFIIFVSIFSQPSKENEKIKNLAICLSQKGVVMYGTYYCPYCQKQKNSFGKSFRYINYIECTKEKERCFNITSVPTWEFKNGKRLVGFQKLEVLAKEADCPY